MVVKKKKHIDVGRIILDDHKLASLRFIASDAENDLAKLLLECVELVDGIQQLHLLKKIGSLLQKLDGVSLQNSHADTCIKILVDIYWDLESKSPLKRASASTLGCVPESLQEEVVSCLVHCLRKELLTVDKTHTRKTTDSIAACMENFSLGEKCMQFLYLEVLQFLHAAVLDFKLQNKNLGGQHILQNKLMYDLLLALKTSMVLVQKVQGKIHGIFCNDPEPALSEAMCGLLTCFIEMILDGNFLQTVHSTAGMATLLFIKTIVERDELLPKLVHNLLFNSTKGVADAPSWLIQSCGALYRAAPPDDAVLFLIQGTLTMLDWGSGRMGDGSDQLLLDILTALLSLNSRLKESSMALSISRILGFWTTAALDALHSDSCSQYLKNSLSGSSESIQKLLGYIWTHWEHPLDAVRHQTKAIFKNILKIHQKTIDGSNEMTDSFFLNLTKSLLDLEWHIKGKYISLSCLVEYLGTDYILTVDDSIPKQVLGLMHEQSLAPYATDLLEKMFISHKNQLMSSSQSTSWTDEWHKTWVLPFLLALCEEKPSQTTSIIDYYLPKLLKCNPDSLTYMIKELRSSDKADKSGAFSCSGALGALMTCLRTARAQGLWSTAEKSTWDQLIPISLMKQALVHKHEQVRLDALGLICETNRTTEAVSQQEMELVKFFLSYNMNSQSAAMRQKIVWVMKKLFYRIRDNSQMLYKQTQAINRQKSTGCEEKTNIQDPEAQLQQYKDFLIWVCDRLFQALFPGASFPSKFIVLSLLGIIAELSENLEDRSYSVFQITDALQPAYADALLGCLNSTFEEVKILAYNLIRKLPATILGLQGSEKLQTLLQAALDLSISTKPYDCVTASYLLTLLVQQRGLLPALRACSLNQEAIDCQSDGPSKDPEKQPDKEIVETNILEVIKYLMDCLTDEIKQAEKSLVLAAASKPLYGRVHCIIAVLQQLSLKSIRNLSEWRTVVEGLILMAFRLSAVVSPICQSSSPEGLIPMDADLETAENLHRIITEIKPQDTNDYFVQVKVLKSDECRESSKNLRGYCNPAENLSTTMTDPAGRSCQVTAQMVLVCCWRSMKEISLLLGFLCQNLPVQSAPNSKDGLLSFHQVRAIGEYFKSQLLQSRHRGAFELAYVGFIKLTEMLTRCNHGDLQKLTLQWLEDVLQEIKSSAPESKLCPTRRSAGIPFYIQALVSSEPRCSNWSLLKMTMKELITLSMPATSQDEHATIPQVHALNILRALFRDTKLGENVIPYVADGLQAAILGFTSPVWAVRNSSTLLFSALITRIFGVKRGKDEHSKKNRMTGREFFTRFPTLHPFLLKQLEMVASTTGSDSGVLKLHPSLFLLLLVLGRLYPSPMDGTCSALSLAPFVPLIIRCGHSPVLRSREMAALALVPFVAVDRILPMAQSLMETLPAPTDPCIRQNQIHGTLLQAFHLLQSCYDSRQRTNSSLHQELHDIIGCTRAKIWLATRLNPCFLTRATFLDIISILCSHLDISKRIELEVLNFWQAAQHIILESELFAESQKISPAPGLIQWQKSITRLTLSVVAKSVSVRPVSQSGDATFKLASETSDFQPSLLLPHLLHSELTEVRLLTLETLLLWLEDTDFLQHRQTNGNVLFLLSGIKDTLKKLAVQDKHPECLAKVLKILCHLDIEGLFPWIVNTSVMSEAIFLRWILSVAETTRSSVEMQSATLNLASKLVIHLVQKEQEKTLDSISEELRQWVHLVEQSCGVEQQTEMRLTAAEVLIAAVPSFLANKQLYLDLQDTLTLWRCIFTLLQDEEQMVRNKVTDVVQMIPRFLTACKDNDILYSVVNPSLALDLGLGLLCELLQFWGQVLPGIVTLIEWMLVEDDTEEDTVNENLGEYDLLFDKSEINLWAEKITFANLLQKHLSKLIFQSGIVPDEDSQLCLLSAKASDLAQHVDQLLEGLPPAAEFSRTADYTRLSIQRVRLLNTAQLLRQLGFGAIIIGHL